MTKKAEAYTGPPEFESLILPNVRNQRNHLASIAGELTRKELDERAAALGMDVSGLRSKDEAVARVQEAVRPVTLTNQPEA